MQAMGEDSDWLNMRETAGYKWEGREPPAYAEAIAALERFAGRNPPDDNVAFLRRQNGGALWHRDAWYLWLWRAEDIPSWPEAHSKTPTEIPGALVRGSDGADEALVMEMREARLGKRYPVFAINYHSWELALPVALDFRSLLLLRHSPLSSDDE
jgi:hypothetical protein